MELGQKLHRTRTHAKTYLCHKWAHKARKTTFNTLTNNSRRELSAGRLCAQRLRASLLGPFITKTHACLLYFSVPLFHPHFSSSDHFSISTRWRPASRWPPVGSSGCRIASESPGPGLINHKLYMYPSAHDRVGWAQNCSIFNAGDTQNTTTKAPKCALRPPMVPSKPSESPKNDLLHYKRFQNRRAVRTQTHPQRPENRCHLRSPA